MCPPCFLLEVTRRRWQPRVRKLYNAGMAVCSSAECVYGHMRALAGDDIASS